MVGNLIIGHFMSYNTNIPNLGYLSHPYDFEEAPVVNQPGPGHLVGIEQPHYCPFHVPYSGSLTIPYMPNLGLLSPCHGLEEVPVVHRPGPV